MKLPSDAGPCNSPMAYKQVEMDIVHHRTFSDLRRRVNAKERIVGWWAFMLNNIAQVIIRTISWAALSLHDWRHHACAWLHSRHDTANTWLQVFHRSGCFWQWCQVPDVLWDTMPKSGMAMPYYWIGGFLSVSTTTGHSAVRSLLYLFAGSFAGRHHNDQQQTGCCCICCAASDSWWQSNIIGARVPASSLWSQNGWSRAIRKWDTSLMLTLPAATLCVLLCWGVVSLKLPQPMQLS